MKRYDPFKEIDPQEWLAIEEYERVHLVQAYHRRQRVKLPDEGFHALFHVVVENQLAMGGGIPARETLQRLMAEGLDRHEAIHALGSVLASQIHKTLQENRAVDEAAYSRELNELTAESWRRSGE